MLNRTKMYAMKTGIMIVIALLTSTTIVIAQEVARGWSVNRVVARNGHPNYSVNGIKLAIGGISENVMGSGWNYLRLWTDNRNWMEQFSCPPLCIYGLYLDLDDGTGELGESTELSAGGVLGMSLTSDAGGYYIVWIEGLSNIYQKVVYAKVNTEGMITLTREIVLRNSPAELNEPEVILDQQGNLNIVYSSSPDPMANYWQWNIEYTKIDKNGNILVQPTVIARSHDNIGFGNQDIAIDPTDSNGIIHMGYTKFEYDRPGGGNRRSVNYMRLSQSGSVISDITFAGSAYSTFSSSIAADNGKVHMAMHSMDCNPYRLPPYCEPGQQLQLDIIYAQASTATGEITVSPTAITQDVRNEFEPAIAVRSDGRVVLVWETQTTPALDENLFYAELDNQGNILVQPTQLTFEDGSYQWPEPTIAIAPNNNIFTAWRNHPSSPGGIVYEKYSRPSIGNAVTLRGTSTLVGIDAPLDAGLQYAVGASFGNSPGFVTPGFGRVPLNPDPLLESSFSGFMSSNIGTLDSDGHGTFQINMPQMAPPNTQYYVAGVLYRNEYLVGITSSALMRVR